jgi:hypothetical protein
MNLRQFLLDIPHSEPVDLADLVPYIPFHRVTHLLFRFDSQIPRSHHHFESAWVVNLHLLMAFPLDITAMPVLQVVEIRWIGFRLSRRLEGHLMSTKVHHLLDSLASRFEQRKVEFIESSDDLLKGPIAIRSIVDKFQAGR